MTHVRRKGNTKSIGDLSNQIVATNIISSVGLLAVEVCDEEHSKV
jgi:hypothetical protein